MLDEAVERRAVPTPAATYDSAVVDTLQRIEHLAEVDAFAAGRREEEASAPNPEEVSTPAANPVPASSAM